MPELTHWKRLVNPDYLGAYSLQPGEEPVYTIKSVARENITGVGGRVEECTVARFVEDVKPMILNRTNCKTIADIHKTPYIEEWAGKRIQLFAPPFTMAWTRGRQSGGSLRPKCTMRRGENRSFRPTTFLISSSTFCDSCSNRKTQNSVNSPALASAGVGVFFFTLLPPNLHAQPAFLSGRAGFLIA